MGSASVRAPGKSRLTFNHILSRSQGELQKSRETGTELYNLIGVMNYMMVIGMWFYYLLFNMLTMFFLAS